MTAAASSGEPRSLVEPGERFGRRVRLDEAAIRAFSTAAGDLNPLHFDAAVARAAGYPAISASGTHTASLFMGLTATHFSQPAADGRAREVLGMGFELHLRAPVFAGDELQIDWRVSATHWKPRLNGWITELDGDVRTARGAVLRGRATLLVRFPRACDATEHFNEISQDVAQ
ncbi:MaoC family dehydratase [Caldimonas sp. KR1-144]|uniref:MaoC family dehydratase n=1 Tax=Caldimonas sp. KR1-144 TaxID=3400911 RepID=UPI003BFC964B